MRKTNRITAIALSIALLLGLTGCNNKPVDGNDLNVSQSDAATTPGEFSEAPTVDIDETAETGTVRVLEYDTTFETSDLVAEFELKYNATVDVELTEATGSAYFEKLGVLVASGDSPDITRYEWRSFPHGMSKNLYMPLDSYIDLDSDLWKDMKDVAEGFLYCGKHYYVPCEITTNYALIYNKYAIEENGLDDPMDLYLEGKWDWDAFKKILIEWCDSSEDNRGLKGGQGTISMPLVVSTGTTIIDATSTEIINNMKSESIQRVMQFCEELYSQGLVDTETGWEDPSQAFVDGKLLFYALEPTWAFNSASEGMYKNDLDAEMAFLPFPKDPNADKYYIAYSSNGYLIPNGSSNVKGALDWITFTRERVTDPERIANARATATSTDPVYYPKCSECKHLFTEEEATMSTCPECNAERKTKYKTVWSEEQYDVYMEMKDTSSDKFSFLFDDFFGFSQEVSDLFTTTTDEASPAILDGAIYYGASYTQLRDGYFTQVESYLAPYRDKMTADLAAG